MAEQVYFDDVEEGMELPTLRKDPTTQQLVMYAGASGDYYQIHYDLEFAKNNGLPNVILHGALKNAFLGHLVTDWIGEWGTLKKLSVQYRGMDIPGTPAYVKGVVKKKYVKKLSVQYRGMDIPGTPAYVKGVVKKKYVQDDENVVECEIWLENHEGEHTTPGYAVATLPSRPS